MYGTKRIKMESTRGRRETDGIIVTQEGKSYADLLRGVRKEMKVTDKEIIDHIDTIRQTREGSMLITMKKDEKKTNEVSAVINKMKDTKIRMSMAGRARRTMLHVRGMDAITTKEEILTAIVRETGVGKEMVRIGELRPFYGSSRAVTIAVPQKEAEKLARVGRIRVEYNWCKVEARVDLIQCYRCWRHGHTAAGCEATEDRAKDCKNCGEKGHLRKDCANDKRCPVCNEEGHSAGTGACPETRQALRVARGIRDANYGREVQEGITELEERPVPLTITTETVTIE